MRPTQFALELEAHARQILDAVRTVEALATDSDTVGAGSVTFGTFASPDHWSLAKFVVGFLREYPNTRLLMVGRNSSTTADAVRSGALDAALVALPIDDAGLDVRPLFSGEVLYVSANPGHTRRPVRIEALAQRSFILYESSAGIADPTRFQLAARAQAAGLQIRPQIEVETADMALEMAAEGLADTYAPHVLRSVLDRRLHRIGFDPPLLDTYALIVRHGSRLARPVETFVDRITAHVQARAAAPP